MPAPSAAAAAGVSDGENFTANILCAPAFGSAAERSASSTSTSSATSSIANEEYTDTRTIMPRAVAVAISSCWFYRDFFDCDLKTIFIRKSFT